MYGPVLRVVGPGQSFGELALLHREARRTATGGCVEEGACADEKQDGGKARLPRG
mgnify:CR=1 FL=1